MSAAVVAAAHAWAGRTQQRARRSGTRTHVAAAAAVARPGRTQRRGRRTGARAHCAAAAAAVAYLGRAEPGGVRGVSG